MKKAPAAPVTSDEPVTADDREPGEAPGTPSADALVALWRDRDVLYAKNPKALDAEQIEAIRTYRLKEVNELPVAIRGQVAMKVLTWAPPQPGQGTGDDHNNAEGLAGWR